MRIAIGLSILLSWGCVPAGSGGSGDETPAENEGGGDAGGEQVPEELPPEAEGLVSITIGPKAAQLAVGVPQQFNAVGVYEDGREEVITELVTWSSSDEALVEVSNEAGSKGLATVHALGNVRILASLGEADGDLRIGGNCGYPEYSNTFTYLDTVPPIRWEGAYKGDGTQFDFDLEEVNCDDDEWGDVSILVFVVGAAWCGACSAYAVRLNQEAATLMEAGGRIVYVEVEDLNYQPATNEFARDHLDHLIGNGPGYRVGDADASTVFGPAPQFIAQSGIIMNYPTVFVVRRSDMRIIAHQGRSQYPLPLVDIARNPDRDWANPPPPVFESNCGPDTEEASEPNDTPEDAKVLSGTVEGGICAREPDYYRIEAEGDWRVDLEFSHAQGDLDVFVWDVPNDGPAVDGPNVVGSDSSDDNESFTHRGPALLRVQGFQAASAPYTLTLTEL